MPRVDLTDRVIVITGASSGIGAATAVACAHAGMHTALLARRADRLEEVAERVRAAGRRAIVVAGSVDHPEDNERLLDEAERGLGPVYGAFANAGYGQRAPCSTMTLADVRAMFEVNFYGSLVLAQLAIERMRAHNEGHVLFCSSCLSKLGLPSYGCYSSTKACQDHFGRAMRHELAGTGVLVSTVHPIGTETEFGDAARARSGNQARPKRARRVQPAATVAAAVVRQLRRGRGAEVWTSLPAQVAFGFANVFPGLTDRALAARERRIARESKPRD